MREALHGHGDGRRELDSGRIECDLIIAKGMENHFAE